MAVAKELYQEWINHPVTQEMHGEIRDSASDAVSRLLVMTKEGRNITDDALKGFVNGLYLIANWVPDFLTEEEAEEQDE